MTAIISDIEQQVRARLKELEPLLQEAEQLKRVLSTFEDSRRAPRGARRSPSGGTGRRGRPAGSATGSRAATALRLVSERPGITVSELADEMGIGTTYLYRVMPRLEREGKVRKSGTGYQLAESAKS